jgi:hypothetical protein
MPDPRKVSGGTLLSDSGIRVVFEGEPTIVWDEHPYIALGTTPLTDYFVRFCKGWMKGRLAKDMLRPNSYATRGYTGTGGRVRVTIEWLEDENA